jgi:DNA-binding MarR family transcriptional regulator
VTDPNAEPDIGLLLYVPYRALETRVFQALAAAGFADLTPAQGRIMHRVGVQGSRLTDLAERVQVTKQTAGFLIDQLERAGYVERTPDPADARARRVRLADRGRAAIHAATAAIAEVEAEWSVQLGVRRMTDLRRILTQLYALTDPHT